MIRKIATLVIALSMALVMHAGEKLRTTLSCEIYNYGREMIYFDCPQTPFIRGEFHRNPGEAHTLTFETDELVSIYVNSSSLEVVLEPGDSLHIAITYGERRPVNMVFSGSDRAVVQNELLWSATQLRYSSRFKSSLVTCAVLDTKPTERIAQAKEYCGKVERMIKMFDSDLSEDFKSYVRGTLDSYLYLSLLEYPQVYQEFRKVAISEQGIADYWTCADDYVIKEDLVTLSNPAYIELLLKYVLYSKHREAHNNGSSYTAPSTLESIYAEVAGFYGGNVREACLFKILSNYIAQGKELERVEPLIANFKEEYCQRAVHATILDSLMQ